jgi:hypothetical protein
MLRPQFLAIFRELMVFYPEVCNLHVDLRMWLQSPFISFYHGATPLVGEGFLTVEASRSHSDTPQSVRLLWASDQPDTQTSTWQHITLTTEIHAHCGIRTHNPSKRAAAEPLLQPRGHGTGNHDSLKPLKSDFFFILYTIQNYGQETTMHYVASKHPYLTFRQTESRNPVSDTSCSGSEWIRCLETMYRSLNAVLAQ